MAKLSSRLTSALAPLGVVALVAGCGGGSMVSGANGSTFVPPGHPASQQTGKATLTLYVPVRGASSQNRDPQYVSPATSTVTVQVAPAGLPSPWPNPVSTSVPTPGPSPVSGTPTPIPVQMTVDAPLGNAVFAVNTYDAKGRILSGVTSTPVPISSDVTANAISLTLRASAQCMQIDHLKNGFTMTPIANQAGVQTATFVVTPCDVDGYVIPAGQPLANQLSFTTTNPAPPLSAERRPTGTRATKTAAVSFSPNAITQGGDTTVTMSYPAAQYGSQTNYLVPSGTGPNPPYQTIVADPVSYLLVSNQADNSIQMLRIDTNGKLGFVDFPVLATGTGPSHLAGGSSVAGCPQSGEFMSPNSDGTISLFVVPTPGPGNPTPLPVSAGGGLSGISVPVTASFVDGSCNDYIGAGGTLYDMPRFLAPVTVAGSNYSNPADGSAPGTHGPAPITAITTIPGAVYLGLGSSGGYLNNIMTATNDYLAPGYAPGTDAMFPYDASHFAVAYHNAANGYLNFALFDRVSGNLIDVTQTGKNETVLGMAKDSFNEIIALTGSSLYNWTPANAPAAPYSVALAVGHTHPTAMAIGIDGNIYVSDAGVGGGYLGTLDKYNSILNYTGTSFTVGHNPNSVIALP